MNFAIPPASDLAARILSIRIENFGAGEVGLSAISDELRLPVRTWANYEAGVMMPAMLMLVFLVATRANPEWLLDGVGERYLAESSGESRSFKTTGQGH